MLSFEQIKEKMKDRKVSVVAVSIGLHENTIYRFLKGRDSRYSTLEKLSNYLEGGTSNEN